ncbi:MAG: hypothetical protein IJS12_09460 [Lachnospiraceae bacterium]|nr:hypothetical protein [Lachnospiraceae bacterium]
MTADSAPGRALDLIGSGSYHIMMPFDTASFLSDVNYTYLPGDMYPWKCLYLAAGILIPTAVCSLLKKTGYITAAGKVRHSIVYI